MEKIEKIKGFYLKNKIIITLAVMTGVVLLANFFHFLWLVAIPFVLLFFTTSSFGEMIGYIVYLAVFSGINEIYASAMVWMFVLTAIRYAIDVHKKRKPFHKDIFFLTLLICLMFSVVPGPVDMWGAFNGILIICLLFFSYFVFIYHKEINIKKCFDLLFIAIFASAVSGLLIYQIGGLKTKIYPFDGVFFRLRLFSRNVNHLAILSLFSMAFILFEIVSQDIVKGSGFSFVKKKVFWIRLVSLLFLFGVGILTMSKAFMLMCVLLMCYLFLHLILALRLKSLVVIAPVIGMIAVLALVFKEKTMDLFSRFFAYNVWNSFFSKIFSGRTAIWCAYRDHIRSSVWTMLFGAGLFTKDLIDIGSHNSFIYIAYRMGFVGVVLLGVLIYLYFKRAEMKISLNFKNIILLAFFLVLSFEETLVSDRFFLFLIFGILITLVNKKKNLKSVQNDENGSNFVAD